MKNLIVNKHILPIILIILAFLCLFSLSSISAGTYNLTDSNSTNDIQSVIDNENDSDLVINLDDGDYNFDQINISRNTTIIGKSKNGVKISGTGTLFNITASNVKFINLTISGYQTAMRSNTGKLSVIGCDISTSGISIYVDGSGDLSGISIENNTIISSIGTNYRGAVYIYACDSTVGVSIKNNNILANAGSGDGLRMDVRYCNNSIIIENNNITGAHDGIDIDAYNSNNTLTLTNNNITGSSRYGLYFYSGYANSTLTINNNKITSVQDGFYIRDGSSGYNNMSIKITNNDITSTTYAVYLSSPNSNNNITVINNNLTGSLGDSIYMNLRNSNSNNVTVINNNLTTLATTSNMASIYIDAQYSNANITIIDNNITALNKSGIWLSSYGSNNTIVISNNKIVGMLYGLYLRVYHSNNTITVANNSIIANNTGIFLDPNTNGYSSISFVWNNITSTDGNRALHFYCGDDFSGLDFSGLSLLNNTFTGGIGLYFELDGATLSDIRVISNTINATNMGISISESSPSFVNMTVNYNRILATELGLHFATTDAGSNFDYNWWGLNDAISKISGFDTNNHYILNITNTSSLANIKTGDRINLAFLVLNTTLTNIGVEYLPYFVIYGTFNGVDFNTSRDDLFMYQFNISSVGLQTVYAELDWEYDAELEFNSSKSNINSTIIVPNEVKIGKTITIQGIVKNENGNPLADMLITITIDGVNYNITTNGDGEWILNYTPTRIGTIQLSVSSDENNIYYGFINSTIFNVVKLNTESSIIISNATVGKSTTVRGVLVDENGKKISNAKITITIGGKSYNLVTASDGSWKLSYTPLKAGKFTAKAYYQGDTNYLASTSSVAYTVSEGSSDPTKPDIRLIKRSNSKAIRHGNIVFMKYLTFKNFGATGSQTVNAKVLYKNFKYKLWKVYNKKLNYKYSNGKIKFKINLIGSGSLFKLKIKVYRPLR